MIFRGLFWWEHLMADSSKTTPIKNPPLKPHEIPRSNRKEFLQDTDRRIRKLQIRTQESVVNYTVVFDTPQISPSTPLTYSPLIRKTKKKLGIRI